MFRIVGEEVFLFLRALGGDGSNFTPSTRDARFTIPSAAAVAGGRYDRFIDPWRTVTPTATSTSICCRRSPARV